MAQHFIAETQVETGAMTDRAQIPTVPDLSSSATRLAALRKHMPPYWSPGEAGGIALLAGLDDENERFFTALASKVPRLARIVPEDKRLAMRAAFSPATSAHSWQLESLRRGRTNSTIITSSTPAMDSSLSTPTEIRRSRCRPIAYSPHGDG
jgi:hypothetical protein